MKATAVFAIALLWSAPFAVAQNLNLRLDSIAAQAKEKAEIDVDGVMLAKAGKIDKKLDSILGGVKEVHVRNYEFSEAGKYSEGDLEPLRKQVGEGSGWSHMVNVKEEQERVEILVRSVDGKPAGFLVIAAEAKELSLIYIVGDIALDKIGELVNSSVKYDLKSLMGDSKAEAPKSDVQP
jgi:hypothetical protein